MGDYLQATWSIKEHIAFMRQKAKLLAVMVEDKIKSLVNAKLTDMRT